MSILESASKRKKLDPNGEIAWEEVHRGLALGYRGGWWQRRIRENGRYIKRRFARADDHHAADGLVTLDYRQALSAVLDASKGREPAPKAEPGTYRVKDACADYLDWFQTARRGFEITEATIQHYILPKLGSRLLAEITSKEIREWHHGIASSRARTRSATIPRFRSFPDELPADEIYRRRKVTSNRILAVLKAALNRAVDEHDLDIPQPWSRVKPFAGVARARVRFLSEAESKRLLNACEPDFRRIVHAALLTGARYGSLCAMRVEDFSPDLKTIYVRKAKTIKSQIHVPLAAEGVELFAEATAGKLGHELIFTTARGKPWRAGDQAWRMKAACTVAKISPPVGFHGLKDSCVSHLVNRGVPFRVVSALTGTTVTTLERHYSQIAEPDVRAVLERNAMKLDSKPSKVRAIR